MPPYTLGQAAKATGRSKAGLLDAIRGGRISASRDDKNQWQIDPAELHRVYPLAVQSDVKAEQEQTPLTPTDLTPFQENAAFFERIIAGLESERDDLRRRLDQSEGAREREAAERREAQSKLTALLTYQPEPKTDHLPEPLPTTRAAFLGASVRFWFALALVASLAALGAAGWLWWERQH